MPGGFAGLPQAAVAAVLHDKAGVVALFDQLPVVEDENLRGVADGGEAVDYHQHGFVLHQRRQRAHQERFVFGIGKGGGFVENQHRTVLQDGAGDGDALAFAAGKFAADIADAGLVALRHCHDEVVATCSAGGSFDFGVCGVSFAEADVVADGVVKEVHVLEDDRDLPHEFLLRQGVASGVKTAAISMLLTMRVWL